VPSTGFGIGDAAILIPVRIFVIPASGSVIYPAKEK
jgi:hypothetical protein